MYAYDITLLSPLVSFLHELINPMKKAKKGNSFLGENAGYPPVPDSTLAATYVHMCRAEKLPW